MSLRSIGRRHATNQRGGNRCHTRLIFLAAIFSSSTSRGEGWGEVWQPLEWRTTRKRAAKVPRSEGGGRIGLNRCQTRNTISLIANYKPRERGGVCRTYVIQAYKRFAKIRETLQVCFRDGVVTVILSSCARATPFERIVLASRTSPLPATIFRMHAKRGASLFLSTRIRRILRFIFFSFSSFFFLWWNFLAKQDKNKKKYFFRTSIRWFRRVHGSRCKIKVEERADSPFVLNPEASARVQRYTVFEPVHPGGRRAPRSAY